MRSGEQPGEQPDTDFGPIQVYLAYTDKGGTPRDLPMQNVPAGVLAAVPTGLQQLLISPILARQKTPNGYFDQLWSNLRSGICGDLMVQVGYLISTAQNQAYSANCTTNSAGVLQASVETQWYDASAGPLGQIASGFRLVLDYWVPLNNLEFTVTSPYTCGNGNGLGCPADNQFTAVFDVHLKVIATSSDRYSFALQPVVSYIGQINVVNVLAGDLKDQIVSAGEQFLTGLAADAAMALAAAAASGGLGAVIGAADIATATLQLIAQLSGIGIAGYGNEHLRDIVSGDLTYISSGTAGSGAQEASAAFTEFFLGLVDGNRAGFRQFEVTAGADNSLIFRLTYPVPAAPTVQNAATAANGWSFAHPTISVSPFQAAAGDQLTVSGNSFQPAFSNQVTIEWNQTVAGQERTEVAWEALPQSGSVQVAHTTRNSFQVNTIPNTRYQFSVRECDPITCAPWSGIKLTTQPAGSDQLTFTMDGGPIIGAGTVGANGSFTASVAIPAVATTGSHTLTANANGAAGPETASTSFTVCPVTGCKPAIWVIGSAGQPQSWVEADVPFTLRGDSFQPGTINIYLNGPNGALIGTAQITSNPAVSCASCSGDWTFTTTLTLPAQSSLGANLVAVENVGGKTTQASVYVVVKNPAN